VLEPEDDLRPVGECTSQLLVAVSERGEDRRSASPPALGEKRCASFEELRPWLRGDRTRVQDVLPWQN
jgi:hypothetical protein